MLQTELPLDTLRQELKPLADFCPFPAAAERSAWEAVQAAPVNINRWQWLMGRLETLAGQPWPDLPATLYMEYARTGNRENYEKPYFERRKRLGQYVLAECLEYRGRWLDEICNGLWCLLGEPYWCIPAHAHRLPGDPLPRLDGTELDLFGCDTAYLVAEILYLLGPELRAHAPSIVLRLEAEMERRVFAHFETRTEQTAWWMKGGNNWAPWCSSNILGAACYMLADTDRLARIADRLNLVVDRFIAGYGDDGGCDEGPGYWGKAAGAMYDYMVRLEYRLGRPLALWRHPKIRNMGEFAFTAQLHESWVLNFADAPAKRGCPVPLTYGFGQKIGSQSMMDMALASQRGFKSDGPVGGQLTGRIGGLHNSLELLFRVPTEWTPVPIRHALTNWLPDLQVAVLRNHEDSARGLIVGAKGGHNDESHNHNDVGNFILMVDGQPGIVDIGTAVYTKRTFSAERYDIWYIRGSAHNAPVVNGVEQAKGREHAARDVSFREQGDVSILSMDIALAYPREAGLLSLYRTFRFDRSEEELLVTDVIKLRDEGGTVDYYFYSQADSVRLSDTLRIDTKPRMLVLQTGDLAWGDCKRHELDDSQLRATWGDHLWVTDASAIHMPRHSEINLRFMVAD